MRRMGKPLRQWSVSLDCDTSRVPEEVLRLVRSQIEEMGRALILIEPTNAFWTSIHESGMRIDVGGWRFHFQVRDEGAVLVDVAPAAIA